MVNQLRLEALTFVAASEPTPFLSGLDRRPKTKLDTAIAMLSPTPAPPKLGYEDNLFLVHGL